MRTIALVFVLSLTGCQFLTSPAGITLEVEVAQDMLEIIEQSLIQGDKNESNS